MAKQNQYCLIEEYNEEVQPGNYCKAYDVRTFKKINELKQAFLAGPLHKGKLFSAKLLPMKLELIVEDEK